jgi:peroxiredoxin (alkyl hydroperoxide reductase subunit C)
VRCHKTSTTAQVSLNDYKDKYLLLFFYPLDFTFVCPTEILEFSKKSRDFNSINTEVLGVSVDSVYAHRKWTETPREDGGLGPLEIKLLSDITKEISRDYGVLIPEAGIALRGSFIIDPKQTVRHISINDLPVGRYNILSMLGTSMSI